MRIRYLLALSFVLSAVLPVYADIALPKDLKQIDPRVRFDGVEKYADHVFVLKFKTFSGGPAMTPFTTIEVKDSKDFNLKAQRRILDMHLLAVERKDYEKLKKDDSSLNWLTDKMPGVLRANVQTPSTVMSVKLKEVPITTYRVSLKDGKLSAELVSELKRSEAAPEGMLPTWTVALAFSLSLAGLGVWFVRRRGV